MPLLPRRWEAGSGLIFSRLITEKNVTFFNLKNHKINPTNSEAKIFSSVCCHSSQHCKCVPDWLVGVVSLRYSGVISRGVMDPTCFVR